MIDSEPSFGIELDYEEPRRATTNFLVAGAQSADEAVASVKTKIGDAWSVLIDGVRVTVPWLRCKVIKSEPACCGCFSVEAVFEPKDYSADNRRRWAIFRRKAR